jgi:hypothetical protein
MAVLEKKGRLLVHLTSALFYHPFLPGRPFLPTDTFTDFIKVYHTVSTLQYLGFT